MVQLETPIQKAIQQLIKLKISDAKSSKEETINECIDTCIFSISTIKPYEKQCFVSAVDDANKLVLGDIAVMFLKPSNQAKADRQSDKDVFKAIGETIKNFPVIAGEKYFETIFITIKSQKNENSKI